MEWPDRLATPRKGQSAPGELRDLMNKDAGYSLLSTVMERAANKQTACDWLHTHGSSTGFLLTQPSCFSSAFYTSANLQARCTLLALLLHRGPVVHFHALALADHARPLTPAA